MSYVGSISSHPTEEIPTVIETLYNDGSVPAEIVSISFEPITGTSGEEENGILTWGLYNYYLEPRPLF